MKRRDTHKLFFVIGLIISILSISAAFFKINFWYFPAVLGIWLVFDYLSSIKNKNTTLSFILKKDWKSFFKIYLLLFGIGVSIELIGRFLLNLWHYPQITNLFGEFVLLFWYPLILMSFREMFMALKTKIKIPSLAFIFSMLLGVLIWEVPNVFSKDWIYIIPYVTLELFGINVMVILGWSVLVGLPLIAYNWILEI